MSKLILILAAHVMLNDPFKPLPEPVQASQSEIVLTMVVVSKSGNIAIINGKEYRLGSYIQGGRINKIRKGFVEILYEGGETKILHLFK
jgi:hypothetical protein